VRTTVKNNLYDGVAGLVVMVFTVTFNNISVISWRWVLLVEGNQSTQRKLSNIIVVF